MDKANPQKQSLRKHTLDMADNDFKIIALSMLKKLKENMGK